MSISRNIWLMREFAAYAIAMNHIMIVVFLMARRLFVLLKRRMNAECLLNLILITHITRYCNFENMSCIDAKVKQKQSDEKKIV